MFWAALGVWEQGSGKDVAAAIAARVTDFVCQNWPIWLCRQGMCVSTGLLASAPTACSKALPDQQACSAHPPSVHIPEQSSSHSCTRACPAGTKRHTCSKVHKELVVQCHATLLGVHIHLEHAGPLLSHRAIELLVPGCEQGVGAAAAMAASVTLFSVRVSSNFGVCSRKEAELTHRAACHPGTTAATQGHVTEGR